MNGYTVRIECDRCPDAGSVHMDFSQPLTEEEMSVLPELAKMLHDGIAHRD